MRWVNAKVIFLTSINTPYCFITFTVHGAISRFIQENKELLLGKVFHAVSGSLLHWCQKHRNFTPGMVMILQTSGDKLNYHVHIHLLITCEGLREEKEWVALKPTKREKPRNGKRFHPAFPPQVLAKGFKEVLEYIARYIKKPPISNQRIVEYDENVVKFVAKDRQSKSKKRKEIIIMAVEYFLMCFLEHIPLEHFPLIRWYGIFSNRNKKRLMPIVQELIPGVASAESGKALGTAEKAVDLWRRLHKENCGVDPLLCPICRRELQLVAIFYPNQLTSLNLSFENLPQFLMN